MYKKVLFLMCFFLLAGSLRAWEITLLNTVFLNAENPTAEKIFTSYSTKLYHKIDDNDINFEAFTYGLKGYLKLQQEKKLGNTKYLTIIDMSVSANTKRFYIINMETLRVEHKSLVAHGRNSGLEYAHRFSNNMNSHQTSLGFYKTAETYVGKHGFSLRLDGLEFSNNKARKRAIVIHEADYTSENFIKRNGRLGRSYGCPSLPKKDYKIIIDKIKNGSCLFIYYPKDSYLKKSKLVNADIAVLNTIIG